ncbi:hypothetical protein OIU79_021428 [Salix purpurea]|uniref:Uncharacterized protein n=1 Tax=Salix purpurea TaxID=77065 RepID=A0A9Q0WPQ9_SALPP|nr:hypothetical protein OIU79_021428 [Salix purpurea]
MEQKARVLTVQELEFEKWSYVNDAVYSASNEEKESSSQDEGLILDRVKRVNDGDYLLEKVAAFSLFERLKFEFVFLRKENISVALEFIFARV